MNKISFKHVLQVLLPFCLGIGIIGWIYRDLDFDEVWDVLKTQTKWSWMIASLFFVGLLMLISSLLMYSVEHNAQPAVFRNAFSGLWWAVCTLTTVGYGDIYPVTVPGRVLGALIAFSGIAALAIPTGIVTAGLAARLGTRKDREQDAELDRQQAKDDEHDRLLREHGELLREISEKLSKLSSR